MVKNLGDRVREVCTTGPKRVKVLLVLDAYNRTQIFLGAQSTSRDTAYSHSLPLHSLRGPQAWPIAYNTLFMGQDDELLPSTSPTSLHLSAHRTLSAQQRCFNGWIETYGHRLRCPLFDKCTPTIRIRELMTPRTHLKTAML